uniref:OCEL domain-containing protein n=1 Tax=Ditylenchus dipsaci TaxID=166011 RepID=A0A915E1W2_9BILA
MLVDGKVRGREFSELVTEDRHKSSVIIKLTDECSAAIHEAVKNKQRLRMHYTRDACIVEIGDPDSADFKRFSCSVSSIHQPVDGVYYDAANERYQTISAVDTKFQVKATDKSFADTREKTQKLLEEQQKRKTMDLTQQQKGCLVLKPSKPKSEARAWSLPQAFQCFGSWKFTQCQACCSQTSGTFCQHHAKSRTKIAISTQASGTQQDLSPPPPPAISSTASVPIRTSPNNSTSAPVSNQFKKRYFGERPEDSSHMIARKKRNESGTSSSASASGSSSTEVSPPDFYQKVYGEIESLYDAKKYHEIFSTEYPEYYECYKTLSAVANEFHELERALKATQIGTPNHNKMEEAIQSKFAKYQQDQEFLNRRQKHADLRSKLDVLKQRIASWKTTVQMVVRRTREKRPTLKTIAAQSVCRT